MRDVVVAEALQRGLLPERAAVGEEEAALEVDAEAGTGTNGTGI